MGRWTDAGFVAYSLDYYIEQLNTLFLETFGEDFDIAPATPQGILIQRLAELLYNTDMDGIEAFSLLNFNTASGTYLDAIGALRGLPRSTGTPQTISVQVTCNSNNFTPFAIPVGHEFDLVGGGGMFISTAGAVINAPVSTITLTYAQTGDSTASIGGKLTTMGLSQIQDLQVSGMVPGSETETDGEYRARLRRSYPVAGQTIEYVQNLLAASPYVRLVGTNYNDTAETVGTLGPYTTEWMAVPYTAGQNAQTWVYNQEYAANDLVTYQGNIYKATQANVGVTPGTNGTWALIQVDLDAFKQAVAKIIIDNKMPGAPTSGNTTVEVLDIFNKPKTVNFTVPDMIKLEIAVGVATPEATGYFDLSNGETIAQQIADYVNGLGIGDDVSYARCMAPITADTNFDVTVFKIRKYVEAPAYDSATDYEVGALVRYQGVVYQLLKETDGNPPDISPAWEEYNEGWVANQNFTIADKEYPALDPKNIRIGASIV